MPEQTLWEVLSELDELYLTLGKRLQNTLGGSLTRAHLEDTGGDPLLGKLRPMKRLDPDFGRGRGKRLEDSTRERFLTPLRKFTESANWFPDPQMTLSTFAGLSSDHDVVGRLTSYVGGRMPEYRRFLVDSHPERKAQVEAAFVAHDRGEYLVSVPLLLIIADGIAVATTEISLFTRDRKKFARDPAEEESFRKLLLRPLSADIPLVRTQGRRQPGDLYLNRHTVLHGEALDYGTLQNSLRAMSFCFYVAFVLMECRRM